MKTIIFNEIQGRFTKSFIKGRLITLRWLKASKINEFLILRLPEAMKSEVMLIYKCNPLIVEGFLFSQ